jgi:hypothetical protein
VNCRNFEFQDELRWYAGNIGDTITLSNGDIETKKFVIRDKYLLHRTKYVSDTGCGCHDRWGMLLSADKDTISMFSDSQYVEKNAANRYDSFYLVYNGKLSGFITEDKSIITNYSIENKIFAQVIIFEYSHSENNQFKKIIIAPEIGVIELFATNGEIWRNVDLETKLNIDISSFIYSENTCK